MEQKTKSVNKKKLIAVLAVSIAAVEPCIYAQH